jgi:hypothetical protein
MHYINLQIQSDTKLDEKAASEKAVAVQVTSTYRTVEGASPYVITASKQQGPSR